MNAEERKQFRLAVAIGYEVLSIVNSNIDLSKCDPEIKMDELVDLMHNIRANVRYQQFDLEATRREKISIAKTLEGYQDDKS
jgi:hypothetical protein